jgi:hypothetical protein
MSYPYVKPSPVGNGFTHRHEPSPSFDGFAPQVQSADGAIDAALRSVPLPDGLLTRLGMLVYSMPDEAADRMDYLGC